MDVTRKHEKLKPRNISLKPSWATGSWTGLWFTVHWSVLLNLSSRQRVKATPRLDWSTAPPAATHSHWLVAFTAALGSDWCSSCGRLSCITCKYTTRTRVCSGVQHISKCLAARTLLQLFTNCRKFLTEPEAPEKTLRERASVKIDQTYVVDSFFFV